MSWFTLDVIGRVWFCVWIWFSIEWKWWWTRIFGDHTAESCDWFGGAGDVCVVLGGLLRSSGEWLFHGEVGNVPTVKCIVNYDRLQWSIGVAATHRWMLNCDCRWESVPNLIWLIVMKNIQHYFTVCGSVMWITSSFLYLCMHRRDTLFFKECARQTEFKDKWQYDYFSHQISIEDVDIFPTGSLYECIIMYVIFSHNHILHNRHWHQRLRCYRWWHITRVEIQYISTKTYFDHITRNGYIQGIWLWLY